MIKKGIVKNVQSNGTWEGQYGLMYKFEVTIGDDTGQCMSKSDKCKFEVGQETEYEFTGGKYPKIKPVSNFQQGGSAQAENKNKVQEYIVKQSSLKCATDYVIANGGNTSSIIEIAEMFTDWVILGIKPPKVNDNNDMPF
jgi:hypothetical protein